MNSVSALLGESYSAHPLKDRFLKWQCLVRQTMMRDNQGRPDTSVMPDVFLPGESEPLGAIITILNKAPGFEQTAEMNHMAWQTHDTAQMRSRALQFLSATYYQKHREFSDILTATFPPESPGAAKIRAAESCRLRFEAYSQAFDLQCRVWTLTEKNPLHVATIAHNRLFNPVLPGGTVVLGFEPDWEHSTALP